MRWTTELDNRLRQLAQEHTYKEVAAALGMTRMAVKQRGRKLGIDKNRTVIFTDAQKEFIKTNFPFMRSEDVAKSLNVGTNIVRKFAYKIGLKKDASFYQRVESGRLLKGSEKGKQTRFKKGNVPFTKGKQQKDFMSSEAIERTLATRFKKGQLPHNTKQDGAISIRTLKGDKKVAYIRVGLNKWELLNRHNYTKHFGEIAPGMMVAFKDGNSLNCDPTNLYLETIEEHMQRNTIHRFDPELKEVIRLLSKYKRKIKQYEKQN